MMKKYYPLQDGISDRKHGERARMKNFGVNIATQLSEAEHQGSI